ncbi:TonB-dependent receptor [Thalassotalea litorea]|uniref:TonB-dependent receptor n=1 Tax=Thalassotalea litorea TaxID=2020715 RepID=A0A5R9IJS0_9GAMM|nr:TonB-dependent receptor [Thalassotalea litorea]TLU64327.1 TonB-dependent receptor [Thalassotalea litorea]
MRHNFKVSAITAAIIASLMAQQAVAQEQQQASAEEAVERPETESSEIEVIEVTGFKGSLRKAINAKKFNDSVSDSIHAEDVGKSTDKNIADALSRVTGVSVIEEGGEGARISIRGTNPDMNQISMNGVSLTSGLSGDQANAESTQSVDLSSFSSDILSSIDVIKTSSADQEEGSLGATVVLRTVKPLQLNESRKSLSVEARYNDFSDKYDGSIVGSFADKFMDDTLGFIITATKDRQETRQDRLNSTYIESALEIVDLDASSGRTATDAATGKPIRVLGYQRNDDGSYVLDEAGNKILNPIESLLNYDPETQALVEGDLYVTARDFTDVSISTNTRDRMTISSGIEWQPLDSTNIQLDITHTQQNVETDYHNFRLNFAPVVSLSPEDPVTEWNQVDLDSNTLVSSYSRQASGFFNRTQGERDLTTDVVSLAIEHDFSDSLTMSVLAGYSNTLDETIKHIGLSTATWGTTGAGILDNMPADIIEPIGYDCSQGQECSFSMGQTPAVFDPYDGSVTSVTSRFNPFDLRANHLGSLNFRDNEQTDNNVSLRVDFDWEIDKFGITSLEFGGKYSEREKDVYTQNETVNTGTALIDNSNPNVSYETVGMQSIGVLDMMSGEAFPYDNFGEGIVSDTSAAFWGGWPMLDAYKAVEEFSGRDAGTVGVSENTQGTRNIQTDTIAAYAKLNFELLDGRLTGNVGLRYVKDDNRSEGVGGINYYRAPHMLDPYNLLIERRLGDIEGSPQCPEAIRGVDPISGNADTRWAPANEDQLTGCWDWALTHGYDYTNDATTPYVNGNWVLPGGMDTNRLVYIDYTGDTPQLVRMDGLPNQITDVNGNLVAASGRNHMGFSNQGEIWPYLDRSTSFVGPNGNQDNSSRREAPVKGAATHEYLLPSLNLNYAINDEMIGRFAVSKTMTRPRFDSLNPALSISENVWDDTANGFSGNANLEALESKNLDVSWEWYFDESGMVSLAFFHKDIKKIEREITTPFHYKDVRTQYELADADLLLDYDANRMPGGADQCMPHRYVAGFSSTNWEIECHTANIDTIKNGVGAQITGLEFGYTQNYDMLPGVLSGLGMSFNYTYQESENEVEEIGTTGYYTQPLPMEFTPEHSANTTVFYEKYGLMLRLAHRFSSEQLVDDGIYGGAIWQDSTSRLDFSSSYAINQYLSITFQATNLTDDVRRDFYTAYDKRNTSDEVVLDDGNYFDGGVTSDRTVAVYNNGRHFRLGVRAVF